MRFYKRYEVIIPKAELQFEIEKLCDFGDVEEYAYILHYKNVRNAHYHIYLCFTNPVSLDDVCKLFNIVLSDKFNRIRYVLPVSWTIDGMLEAFLLKDRHYSYDSSCLKASIGLHEKYPEIFRK